MPHLEVILDAYSVNSGKTYSLQVRQSVNMAILSQAGELHAGKSFVFASEGATTKNLCLKT